jgi:SAM-dependent methyltransferase
MKVQDFPAFLTALGRQTGSFDPVHILYHHLFQSGYLHFGFWPEGDGKEVDVGAMVERFRSAQTRFADELLAYFPPGTYRVLDVGAGQGRFSSELASRGHAVTAVTPCAYQAEQIMKRYPAVTVKNARFQEVGLSLPPRGFDLILFSESFRYIALEEAFPLFDRLLSRDGCVVIADWFVHAGAKARHGHDHDHHLLREHAASRGFTIAAERDVTENILPTIKLAYDVLCEFYMPLAQYAVAKLAQRYPRLYRLCLDRILRWFERRILPQIPGRIDPAVFAERYRYYFFVLKRAQPST